MTNKKVNRLDFVSFDEEPSDSTTLSPTNTELALYEPKYLSSSVLKLESDTWICPVKKATNITTLTHPDLLEVRITILIRQGTLTTLDTSKGLVSLPGGLGQLRAHSKQVIVEYFWPDSVSSRLTLDSQGFFGKNGISAFNVTSDEQFRMLPKAEEPRP